MEAVELLLTMDPHERPAAKEVMQMRHFACIDWENIGNTEPPFVPTPDNPTDNKCFYFYFCSLTNFWYKI